MGVEMEYEVLSWGGVIGPWNEARSGRDFGSVHDFWKRS